MRVLADHCVPGTVVAALRLAGHRVERIVDITDPRLADRDVAELASRTKTVLITADTDFLSRSSFPPKRHSGIIVLRDLERAHERVLRRLLRALDAKDLSGILIVLDGRSSRVRR